MCEGSKPKRNKSKKTDLKEKSRGGKKEGSKATASKEKNENFEFLASVQQGKLAEEKCRKKPRGNSQDAKKPCGVDKREKENRHMKTTLADRNGKSVNCVEKSPQNAFLTKRCTSKLDKSKNISGARMEDSQRKMKMVEELEVKALDTWTAVRDKKRKAKEKKQMTERTSSNEEVFGHRKEEAREQNVEKSIEFQSVEYNEKERRLKKKLQLLDEIMKMDTNVESSDCNKIPKPGRKERNDHTTISEQMIEKKNKRSDEELQRTPTHNGLVTIPREDHLKQLNSPPTLNAKTVPSAVGPINHARGQKPCGQPLNGPVKVPARPVDSPCLSDIRQRGMKVLSTHQPSSNTKPMAVFPSKQSKSHCNFPEICGSIKQTHTDASSSSSYRIPACSAMRLSPYNKPGRPPATRIHVPPYIPTGATTDQVAKKTTTRAPTAREMMRIPQSAEKIENLVHTTNLHAKSKALVDRTKVLVISQSKRETTVSIKCCIQKKVDDERPLPAEKTNRNANSQNFSAYKTGTSKGPPSSRKLLGRRQHGS